LRRGSDSQSVVTSTLLTYACDVTRARLTARQLPASLAPLVQELELRRPRVVTDLALAEAIEAAGSQLDADVAAERLVKSGWLLPLRTRRSWEFAPAARAGRLSAGDDWIEVRALLAHDPGAPIAVGFESAVWLLGFSSHQPSTPVYAHRAQWRPPRSLGHLRSVTFDWRLPAVVRGGLPVLQAATVVVAAAARPHLQGDWANADDWLPEAFRATTPNDVLSEASGRAAATLIRLGYLAEWSGREDVADLVAVGLRGRLPVSYLGPRDRPRRWANRWRLYDSLLPKR
jgi:hypothetical protein